MSSFRVGLSQAGLLGLTREVRVGRSTRYLYYTRFAEEDKQEYLIIGLSDGAGVWKVKLAEDALMGQSQPANVEADSTKILSEISQALQNDKLELTKLQDAMKLSISCSSREMDFDLIEVSAAERREESRTLLFNVWDSLEDSKRQAERNVDMYSCGGDGVTTAAAATFTESKAVSRPKKIKGASLFNPNTKRRKAAAGVVFDSKN